MIVYAMKYYIIVYGIADHIWRWGSECTIYCKAALYSILYSYSV